MDLQIIETGNGGDLFLKGVDLAQVDGFENMIYLGLFGGNVAMSTPDERAANEMAYDWWGNSTLMPNNSSQQFNSQTERALNTIPLTSGNLIYIQNAVNADLDFMQPLAEVTVTVAIIGVDKVRLQILVKEPNNVTQKEFLYIWDGTKQDLLGAPNYQPPIPQVQQNGLQYGLQFNL